MPVTNAEKEEKKEQWVVDIETKYRRSYDPREYGEKKKRWSIYRWPNDLVAASSLSRHRAPRTVSLGPYHHGEPHLQHMEHHKERALHRILHRTNIPLSKFVQSLQDVEQELWDSYDNLDLKLSRHLFLQMMLFDGCFLLELLRFIDSSHEPFFGSDGSPLVFAIRQDMLILENQIPLLVLEKLLEVEEGNNPDELSLVTAIDPDMLILESQIPLVLEKLLEVEEGSNHKDLHLWVARFYGLKHEHQGPCLHILDIYRKCLIGDNTALVEEETPISICSHFQLWLHLALKGLKRVLIAMRHVLIAMKHVLITMLIAIPILVFWILHGRIPKHGHFRTVTKLHEAGIEFKKGEPGSGLTITFDEKNGVITLPNIELSDSSPIFYMNLMAFERMHPPLFGNRKVTNYMAFMDELIDSAEDVSVLCSRGIVNNLLGSDKDAAKLFNAFSDGLLYDKDSLALSKQWQRYAASDWHLAVAYLKHNYFHNAWSVVSLLAAIIFLVLTITQTVFSGMQALKDGK